jgi:pimeloyl-ACP methyl ester carboxylesterase/membrane protein DedA with SNARE-associated domain
MAEGPARHRGWLRPVLLTWLVLLFLSDVVRWLHPWSPKLREGERAVLVAAVRDTTPLAGRPPVRLAYREWRPADGADAPVVLLVHGSPGDGGEVRELAALVGEHRRAIAPDLPGFGASSPDIPDYSIRAHGRYLLELLDSLHIARAHLVGFSMGGGVVEEMARQAPGRVLSLTLLSAIGVQEMELLGDYYLNHAIHGLQLAGLWLLREGTPHFGWLDDAMLGVPYARNFYDSDQRPLRGVLAQWQGPTLILHGEVDPLVPVQAAREHARLVPQAELVLYPGDHFMAFLHPDALNIALSNFLAAVDSGRGVTRTAADPDRIAASRLPFDLGRAPRANNIGLFVAMLLIAAATLVSEDLTCIGTGILVARGSIGFWPGTIACLIGIFVGDVIFFALGRLVGRAALQRPPLRWLVRGDNLDGAVEWFRRRGPVLVFVTRFLPGFRVPTYVAAGVLHTGAWTFIFWFLLAALVWTPALVGLSAGTGHQMVHWLSRYEGLAWPALLSTAAFLFLLVRVALPLATWRGRRLMLSRWRRLARWEFWPMWAFYPPVVLYILYLALRHRSLTLFTAANPAIPGGGFVGESKGAILQGLAHAPGQVARWELIPAALPPADRLARAEAFLEHHGLGYPVVLKPDTGERGSGVRVIRTPEELGVYLAGAGGDTLIQEHVEGREFGVFYYRYPGEARGRIFSITDKRIPSVTGDGRRTLESLILADDRAVCLAPLFLARLQARLLEVPPAGEVIALGDLGNHCQGAVFLDGGHLISPALEAAIEALAAGYEGFFFGRFDLRVPSEEDFRAGRSLKVLELNGASSEATHIYDPRHGPRAAWRTLREQWRILFAIGERNRRAGVRPLTVTEFLRAYAFHRRQVEVHPAEA